MAVSFNDLPQELCNRIIQFSRHDRKTLSQLCLTSTRFVIEAQTYLYAHLTRNTTSLNFARSSKLLSTLTVHNPSLAKYVKTFVYYIRLRKDNPAYEDLRRALRLMINVTWLEINTTIPQGFFDSCTFQLKHFRCAFASSDTTAIYNMLSTQHSLQSVYIDKFDHDFPSDCCLNIKRLCVEDWRSIEQILPGRSIEVLELLQVGPFFDSVPPSITTQLGNLTHLTFQTDAPYEFLESVAPYLTCLMILRIIGKDDTRRRYSSMTIAREPQVLWELTNLKIFVWSLEIDGNRRIQLGHTDELREMLWDLVEGWFLRMPKLEEVYTLDYSDPFRHSGVYYSRWTNHMNPESVEAKVALGRKSFYTK
ncbi:hypothetical protein AGABI1DRAFT_108062 [Agaricus bisporus var. burnettii JB137-S8]|uniref:F-box domain-containing protein n=1 Tax=Agaricus bisporus var. burnettii (strain JB137-S8 / ATCC MYA-4627 / FGSC 10392) TaxID=597362 RepID=K5XRP2_AGABU|nr:uncharacterized protein AGABI1DRAFT_108062 [Agaricus bisporus var. burnettii JB137-S8]EKM77555.1 hypothetical protein AGABI1DRAFT_108062 [Agaricus bisporus var. burnettii JB137-S8]